MLLTPVIETVLVPFVKIEPAPLVFQFPESVRDAVVSVIVPLVPPVIVTPVTAIVEAFAVRMPPLPTVSAPPVNPRLAVTRAVVEDPSDTVRVPPQFTPIVCIVKACADAADEVNVMLLNSVPGKFVPANVMVPPVALANVTVLPPAAHVADVDALVHVPLTVQFELPRLTLVAAVRIVTFPVTVTVEFRAMKVPCTSKSPFTVSAQLDPATVSSVPVNPVMSMLAIVVAAARDVVPVGVALKM